MSHGRFFRSATPEGDLRAPNSRFVADFIGNVNMLDGELTLDEADRVIVDYATSAR